MQNVWLLLKSAEVLEQNVSIYILINFQVQTVSEKIPIKLHNDAGPFDVTKVFD